MHVAQIAAFWGVSMLFVVTPGADWAYALAAGVRDRTVLPAVGGLLCGHLFATLVVAAGVAGLVAGSSLALTVLTLGGATYLAWLGAQLLRRPVAVAAGAGAPVDSPWQAAARGAVTSGSNPKVFLLVVALLPQYVATGGVWPVAVQVCVLGGVHLVNCALVYGGVGVGARRLLRTRPGASRIVSRVSGVVMICIGLVLVGERLTGRF